MGVKPILWTLAIGAGPLLTSLSFLSCAGKRPSNLGVSDTGLASCPSSPNCVSSDARDARRHILPLMLAVAPAEAWGAVREVVSKLPRTRIVEETGDYLHAECRSAWFGFVDDLELHLRPAEKIIAVRSAARLGYFDFGVNRRRVEGLRDSLTSRGIFRIEIRY